MFLQQINYYYVLGSTTYSNGNNKTLIIMLISFLLYIYIYKQNNFIKGNWKIPHQSGGEGLKNPERKRPYLTKDSKHHQTTSPNPTKLQHVGCKRQLHKHGDRTQRLKEQAQPKCYPSFLFKQNATHTETRMHDGSGEFY